jgi:hypothetical protein
MIYTHVLNQGPGAVRSPLDRLVAATGSNTRDSLPLPSPRPTRAYLAIPRKLTRHGGEGRE